MSEEHRPLPVVVLISGGGSNLQALIDDPAHGRSYRIVAVISNRDDAFGLERAARHGIPTQVLRHDDFASRDDYDRALMALIDEFSPELVVLAGFMRILTPDFVRHYAGRMLNIHPSLLPKFQGLHTHRRALEAGEEEHGASVHFVTEELDGGPLVARSRVAVLPGDDEKMLAARVLEREHRLFPTVVKWFADGRLRLRGDMAELDGAPLEKPREVE